MPYNYLIIQYFFSILSAFYSSNNYASILSLRVFFFWWYWGLNLGPHTKQALNHLNLVLSPFCFSYFSNSFSLVSLARDAPTTQQG
jgi:hypothetical protein